MPSLPATAALSRRRSPPSTPAGEDPAPAWASPSGGGSRGTCRGTRSTPRATCLHGGLDGLLPLGPALLHRHVEGGLLHGGRAARAPLHAARPRGRRRWPPSRPRARGGRTVGHERHTEAQAQVVGHLGQRADDDLGGRASADRPSRKWCSTCQMVWNPNWSASLICSSGLGVGPLFGVALP